MSVVSEFPGATAFASFNGHVTFVNETTKLLFNSKIEMRHIQKHFEAFKFDVERWLGKFLLTDSGSFGTNEQALIQALQGQLMTNPGGYKLASMRRIHVRNIPPSTWEAFNIGADTGIYDKARIILGFDRQKQRKFWKRVVADAPKGVYSLLKEDRLHQYLCPGLEQLVSNHHDAGSFIEALDQKATQERDARNRKSYYKTIVYDAFILYLADRRVVLRPYMTTAFFMDAFSIDIPMLTKETRALWKVVTHTFRFERRIRLKGTEDQNFETRTIALKINFLRFVSCTTVRLWSDLSAELFELYIAGARRGNMATVHVTHIATIYRALRESADQGVALPLLDSRKKRPRVGRYPWVHIAYTKETAQLFPIDELKAYRPRPIMIEWDRFFDLCFGKIEVKSAINWRSSFQHFLIWLALSGRDISCVSEIRRADINDGLAPAKSKCFRAYLLRRNLSAQYFNNCIWRLYEVFSRDIADRNLGIANPIVPRFDTLKIASHRAKTPRHALGRELMEFIREFNERDDFAFSRTRPAHRRALIDPVTKELSDVWFPAPSILIDFLLRIPVRGFQARFLDSGEGDEYEVVYSDLQAKRKSRSPIAIKGRREGVLCSIPNLKGDPILGLYINTNKTSVDRESGYEIPWCDENVKANLTLMADWQKAYNPISRPVYCCERGRAPESEDVLTAIKTTYPLFRDPANIDYLPISREALSRYWDDLLAAVEAELKEKHGRDISLTDEIVVNKGHGKSDVRKHARFDLHSLRVSGITALIEAGLPPDLVMTVAGHSAVVMTLYYNKASAASLNEKLTAVMQNVASDVTEKKFRQTDLSSVADYLVNTRAESHQIGHAMLRDLQGRGDGAVEVMSHGICPGGECATGGEFINGTYASVPRKLACSLCRYRLTGPMFLPGQIANANRLMHELRAKGRRISALNNEIRISSGVDAAIKRSQVSALYRETDAICEEWAAEVTYVRVSEKMLADSRSGANTHQEGLPMIVGAVADEISAKLEQKSELALLQSLAESAQTWSGFRPQQAMIDHREFLNEMLASNNLDPFLLRLEGEMRDEAAYLLGKAIVAAVPDERLDGLRRQPDGLQGYPTVVEVIERISANADMMRLSTASNHRLRRAS